MKDYIVSMLAISLICFVSRELMVGTRLEGYIGFVAGICVFLVAIAPLISSIEKIGEITIDPIYIDRTDSSEYESIFEDYIENAEIDLIKGGIRDEVCGKFDLDPSEIRIYISYNEGSDKRLERVTVNLLGSAAFANSNEIITYLEGWLGCEVVATIG